ncbi:MAG: ATP-binding protein [Syntrophorhabdales bacterium]|jgi:PAS domain S-box-containing protein
MPAHPKDVRALRRKAEKLLLEAPEKLALMSGEDLQGLVHGLSVHQIELEMQNEELRRSREQLEESRSEYAELYDFAPVGYLTFDKMGLITRANLTACGLLGIERSFIVKNPFSLFIHPDSQDLFYLHKQKVMETKTTQICQLVLKRKHGTFFDAQLESVAAQVHGATAIRTILTDITERKQAESERKKLESQLCQAQKMEALGVTTGGIAHDFNNILAAIIGFAEMMANDAAKGSPDERLLKGIMAGSIRARELVRQMLTFSRKTGREKRPLRVNNIVKETVTLIRATTPTTISIRVADTLSGSGLILGDPAQIQQVLMNLCTNASYAMRGKGGLLDIDLSDFTVPQSNGDIHGMKPGLYVKLVVRDTGTGIPPDIVDKIFDPFFTTKGLGKATGLGLSVVHGIVKQHGGYITVENGPDRGSTFTVYFPRIGGGLETDAVSDDVIPTGSERILFVDDEEALVDIGEKLLAKLGYNVVSRTSSGDALALVNEDPSRFDLVITDQTMPEMTGIELAREILAIRADMPIIMCTGFSHTANEESAKAAGIKAFAMKPLTKREIAKTIRKVLDE